MTTPEERLVELGLQLPIPPAPVANYMPHRLIGSTLYLSGQVSRSANGNSAVGCLGDDMDVDEGYAHARSCALQLIAVAKAAVGDLSRLSVAKVLGMVRATPEFERHPQVIDGASDLLVAVFGVEGHHARSAVGVSSLPRCAPVEIEAIFHVR